jgi:hypothetical protein
VESATPKCCLRDPNKWKPDRAMSRP